MDAQQRRAAGGGQFTMNEHHRRVRAELKTEDAEGTPARGKGGLGGQTEFNGSHRHL